MTSGHTRDIPRLSHRVVSAVIVEQFSCLDEAFSKKCSNIRKSYKWGSSDHSGRKGRVTEIGNQPVLYKRLISATCISIRNRGISVYPITVVDP